MNTSFEYTISGDNKVVRLTASGDMLGGQDAYDLTKMLGEIAELKPSTVVFDLEKVNVVNSSGLGMFVSSLTTLKKHNISMLLSSVPDKVLSLLEMTHLNKVFSIFENFESANNSLQ